MKPGEAGFIKERRASRMTPRRREVLYHVAFGEMHGSRWRARQLITGIRREPIVTISLNGVDVTAILQWLARQRLIRLWYRSLSEIARDGYTQQRCLCITAKGIEELLCPTT